MSDFVRKNRIKSVKAILSSKIFYRIVGDLRQHLELTIQVQSFAYFTNY